MKKCDMVDQVVMISGVSANIDHEGKNGESSKRI